MVKIHINVWKYLSDQKEFMLFEFIDNGMGIDNRRKKLLFEEKESEKNTQGLGIGLTLIKKLVKSYNGVIWVEDRVAGKPFLGTKFSILIPTW